MMAQFHACLFLAPIGTVGAIKKQFTIMTLTFKQKLLAGAGILLLILIITNPSAQAFKEYVGSSEGVHKQSNFFAWTIYRKAGSRYLGLFGNFFRLSESNYTVNAQKQDTVLKEPTNKLTISQFAAKIKSKYPEYKDVDNKTLVEKMLVKYPVYKESVDLQSN